MAWAKLNNIQERPS